MSSHGLNLEGPGVQRTKVSGTSETLAYSKRGMALWVGPLQ